MPENSSRYTYGPAGQANVLATGQGYAVNDYPYVDFERLLAMRREAAARAKKDALAAAQVAGPVMSQRFNVAQQAGALEGGGAPRAQMQQSPGIAKYVKMVSGPGVVPGYTNATAFEPGAVFAGYAPENSYLPQAAHFVSRPGFDRDEGPDLYSPEARRRAAANAYR